MKTLKLFLLALLAPVLFSCAKDSNDSGNKETKAVSLTVKFEMPVFGSKSEVAPVPYSGYQSEIETAYIYVTDMAGNVITTHELLPLEITESKATFATTNDAYNVLVVANYPSGFTSTTYASRNVLENTALSMANLQPDVTDGTDHGVKHAMMYNSSFVNGGFAVTPGDPEQWGAEIQIAPVVARFEIAKVDGTALVPEEDPEVVGLKSYTLAGVFMNNIYPSLKLANNVQGTGTILNVENSDDAPTWAKDVYETEFMGGLEYMPLTSGNVWAYHIAPTTLEADIPHVVLHLQNVVYDTEDTGTPAAEDDLFVPVKAYRVQGGSADVKTFARGTVYQIANIKFNRQHVTTTPSPQAIMLTATITIKGWEFAPIEPNLD